QVFDDEGKDVTPHPLFHSDPDMLVPRQGKLWASSACFGATGPAFLSSFSTCQTSGVHAGSVSWPYSSSSLLSNATAAPLNGTAEPASPQDTTVSLTDVRVRQEEITEEVTKKDLDGRVDIYLTETETLWILAVPPVVLSVESEDAGRVLEQNKIYADICKNRPGNDRFVEKMMQTLNGAAKHKEVQCDKIIMEDKGTMVTSRDLHNSFNISEMEPVSRAGGSRATPGQRRKSHATEEHDQPVSVSLDTGSTTSTTISENAALARIHKEQAVLTSENFQQHLFSMERILMENIFQPQLAAYWQLPVLRDPALTSDTRGTVAAIKEQHNKEKKDKEEQKEALVDPSILLELNKTPAKTAPPSLERLWSYMCNLTNGHSVSSMAWSKVNPDLLAVGYGAFDFKEQKKGLACCWSLKNPRWPERIFPCEHGVTALDFSTSSPKLLAVGMYDGSVAIFDVRSRNTAAFLDSRDSSNNHTGPVWQLRWVEQDRGTSADGRKERLVCLSADGRVNALDCTDLMKIKRTESEKKNLPGEALLSREAAGMCFDFHPKDTNIYLAGTEEGLIHRCSCLCNEHFLETYRGHTGPVYKVAWNPFSTDMFLSCSADWSIILWHQDSQMPILTFHSATAFVHDIMWSPKSAFVFAAVNESSTEIWDLSASTLNPTISRFASPRVTFTSVLFAKNTDCLLVGDSKGEVSVFELQNLAVPGSAQ
ncbi:WD repeat-containing protein 78, partial [Buceros rhinoceros silvestris]